MPSNFTSILIHPPFTTKPKTALSMAYNSIRLLSIPPELETGASHLPLGHRVISSTLGHGSTQDSSFPRLGPVEHEQSQHQMAEHFVADSETYSEADSDVSLPERDVPSETTNSTIITPEDLDRISREYEETVKETYNRQMGHHSSQGTLSY